MIRTGFGVWKAGLGLCFSLIDILRQRLREVFEYLFLFPFMLANYSFQGRSPSRTVAVRGSFN